MSSVAKNETTKLTVAIACSLLVGAVGMTLVSTEVVSPIIASFIIPGAAYVISILISVIYQYSTCNTLNMASILISNTIVAATNGGISALLLFESIPVLRYLFGPYAPRSPLTGLPYSPDSAEYGVAMANEDHYKIQFLSSIVKAVIPMYLSDQVKNGIVYMYWNFWMTLLPLYFVLSIQGLCN
jgi:hypothetical protein